MKSEVRKILLGKRKTLKDISEALVSKIVNSHILDKYKHIGIYYPLSGEVNILKLLDIYKDKSFYFPKTINKTDIKFYKENDLKNFKIAKFNVFEPLNNIETLKEDIEVFIIPCVGLDSNLRRIGYGMGYYDRYLSDYKGLKVAVIQKELCLDYPVCDDYDLKMDNVIVGD